MTSTFTSTNGLIATSFRRDDASNHIVRMPHLRRAWNIRSARPNVNFALNEEERHQRDMALALRYRNRGNQAGIRALANQLERLNLNRAVPEPARGHFIMARRFMQPGEQSPLPGRQRTDSPRPPVSRRLFSPEPFQAESSSGEMRNIENQIMHLQINPQPPAAEAAIEAPEVFQPPRQWEANVCFFQQDNLSIRNAISQNQLFPNEVTTIDARAEITNKQLEQLIPLFPQGLEILDIRCSELVVDVDLIDTLTQLKQHCPSLHTLRFDGTKFQHWGGRLDIDNGEITAAGAFLWNHLKDLGLRIESNLMAHEIAQLETRTMPAL